MKLPKAHSRTHTHAHRSTPLTQAHIRVHTHTHTRTHAQLLKISKRLKVSRPLSFVHFFLLPPALVVPPTISLSVSCSRGLFRPARNHLNSQKKRLKPDGASGRRKYLPHCEREENWNAMPRQISGIRFSFGFSSGRFGTLRGFSIEHALRCRAYPRETPTRAPSLSPYVEKLLRVSLKQSL